VVLCHGHLADRWLVGRVTRIDLRRMLSALASRRQRICRRTKEIQRLSCIHIGSVREVQEVVVLFASSVPRRCDRSDVNGFKKAADV